jgi:protein-S-isoprenylcysteine O-methyltransferase Ste14
MLGKRGEGWFAIQLAIFAIILLVPDLDGVEFPLWVRGLGGLLMAAAGLGGMAGILSLGSNLTPFPRPVPQGHLITHGVYGIVRHPIYSAIILAALGFGLLTGHWIRIGLAGVLLLFFDLKTRREERWLAQAYPEYAEYRQRVKKLIPGIY